MNHTKINGFANAWSIENGGEYAYTIEYLNAGEEVFLGLISIIMFIILLIILLYTEFRKNLFW